MALENPDKSLHTTDPVFKAQTTPLTKAQTTPLTNKIDVLAIAAKMYGQMYELWSVIYYQNSSM